MWSTSGPGDASATRPVTSAAEPSVCPILGQADDHCTDEGVIVLSQCRCGFAQSTQHCAHLLRLHDAEHILRNDRVEVFELPMRHQ